MSSDSINNALTHESWTDGRYIQCSAMSWDDTTRIRVFSRLDGDLNYTEEPFRRKDFANIKDSGWHIISPEGLVKYAMNQVTDKKPVKLKEPEEKPLETYDVLPEQLKLQAINSIEDWTTANTDSDKEFDYVMGLTENFIEYYQLDYPLWKNEDHVARIFNIFTNDWVIKYVNKSNFPNLYKKIHNLGLTQEDLRWIHNIELENNIMIEVDDLSDFDNMAAISVVKKRIRNAIESKRK